jgi:hypothetical protein
MYGDSGSAPAWGTGVRGNDGEDTGKMNVFMSVVAGAAMGLVAGAALGDVPFGVMSGLAAGGGFGGMLYAWRGEGRQQRAAD